jgi:hypothetical protein
MHRSSETDPRYGQPQITTTGTQIEPRRQHLADINDAYLTALDNGRFWHSQR